MMVPVKNISSKSIVGMLVVLCIFITACNSSNSSQASNEVEATITVSAAASLRDALHEIAIIFSEKHPDIKVDFNFGGSGALRQQIIQGAPVDIFFSASVSDFQEVVDEGYIAEESTLNLLRNELVLIVPQKR